MLSVQLPLKANIHGDSSTMIYAQSQLNLSTTTKNSRSQVIVEIFVSILCVIKTILYGLQLPNLYYFGDVLVKNLVVFIDKLFLYRGGLY